jgi:hypothetical protein
MEFGQSYCKDFLKRDPKNLFCIFRSFTLFLMIFRSFTHFLGIYLFISEILEKVKHFSGHGPAFGPWPTAPLGQWPKDQWPKQPCNWTRGRVSVRTSAWSPWPQPAQWRGRHRLTVGRGAARCAG